MLVSRRSYIILSGQWKRHVLVCCTWQLDNSKRFCTLWVRIQEYGILDFAEQGKIDLGNVNKLRIWFLVNGSCSAMQTALKG